MIVGQPEQVPLTWYYLRGLQYASTLGRGLGPHVHELGLRAQATRPRQGGRDARPLLATLRPGQQVLFIRPLTEGANNWKAAWTLLVRRRSAQFGAILASDPSLKPIAWAPHTYPGACCVADSATLYRKT